MDTGLILRGLATPAKDAWSALRWSFHKRGPAPRHVKQGVLSRYGIPDSIWIETGTYLGRTAAFLATIATRVCTIEPSEPLFRRARMALQRHRTVSVLHGTSEQLLPALLADMSGPVSFWLDGHFSDGVTFRGECVTPIEAELAAIGARLDSLGPVAILIDDVRLFGTDPGYPPVEELVDWADRHGFAWHVEHDIFIMRRPPA